MKLVEGPAGTTTSKWLVSSCSPLVFLKIRRMTPDSNIERVSVPETSEAQVLDAEGLKEWVFSPEESS